MRLYNETFGHKQKETLPSVICDPCTNLKGIYAKWNKPDRKRKIWIVSLTYELKKKSLTQKESRMVNVRGWGTEQMGRHRSKVTNFN